MATWKYKTLSNDSCLKFSDNSFFVKGGSFTTKPKTMKKPLLLKPCPLCGCKKSTAFSGSDRNPYGPWFVVCDQCGCSTGPYEHRRSAIKRWNKRVGDKPFDWGELNKGFRVKLFKGKPSMEIITKPDVAKKLFRGSKNWKQHAIQFNKLG